MSDDYLEIKDIVYKTKNIIFGFDCKRKYRNRKFKKYHHKGLLEELPIYVPVVGIPLTRFMIRTFRRNLKKEKVSKK